jgi:hypothetical protein
MTSNLNNVGGIVQRNNKSPVNDGKIGRVAALISKRYVDPSFIKEEIMLILTKP